MAKGRRRPKNMKTNDFQQKFLENYLQFGLGALPKSDIDALVMYLIDQFGYDSSGPLAGESNQRVSERLRTPVAKIKRLRYEAALKFGGNVEDQAKARLLAALSRASIECEKNRVRLLIEDSLAKHWLQGKLKDERQIFDHPFNSEIVEIEPEGLFRVLESIFGKAAITNFRKAYDAARSKTRQTEIKAAFAEAAKNFAQRAAEAAGGSVLALLRAQLG